MNFYLSYGAGIGSEALRLWLLENKWPHEAVYVDHGCDWPETQEFVKTIPDLMVIKPNYQGHDNLYKYCISVPTIPSIKHRWCTAHFKVEPFNKYIKRPCIIYLGFTIEEAHRASNNREENIYNHYPLIAMGWTRKDCENYIHSQNMFIPIRSNCWFCPFQNKGRYKQLRKTHPDLYQKAKELEAKKDYSIVPSGKLEDITQEAQYEMF